MKLTQLILEGLSYKVPNFDYEWEEAVRYPEFKKLGKHDWIDLATKGREVTITSAKGINNTDANNPKAFNSLNKDKRERTLAQIQSGTVEMPIVAKYPDGYKELLGGNTRLTALMAKNGKATIWMFDVPEDILDENYADDKVKDQLRKYIDDYTEIDLDLLKKLLKDKKKYPQELDPRTGGNKFGYRGMTFKKEFIDKLKPIRTSNGVTEYEAPSNLKVKSRSDKGYLSFTTDEQVAKGFGHYSGYVDHKKSPGRVGGYVRASLDNPNFILHPDFTGELSKDLEYSKESEKETLLIGNSFNPDRIYVVDEKLYKENYADGKVKGKSRPGRVKKSGASCKGSVSSLRAKAKKYGGEKGKMYHWCANMKGGKK